MARNLTDDVMADAEVTGEEVKQLPRTALVGLAKEENSAKRAEMLRKASKAEAPGKEVEKLKDSTKKQPDRRDPTPYEVRYSNAGRVLLRTHKPVDELSADQCRRILEVLTPAWEDLQDRAGG